MEVVTYTTVQGRQLRMTPATATFFPFMDAAARGTVELRKGARASLRHSSCNSTKDDMCVRPAAKSYTYQHQRVRMCGQVQVTTVRFSRPGDIIGAEGG